MKAEEWEVPKIVAGFAAIRRSFTQTCYIIFF